MKRLLLFRHAKTEPDNKGGDRARELTARGRNDAALMGRCIRDSNYLPDLAMCSTSARTRETWKIASGEWEKPAKAEFTDSLYLATAKALAAIARGAPDSAAVLMLLGHNPGMEECAKLLARKPATPEERSHLDNLAEKFSTGALAVLDFEVQHWRDIGAHAGALSGFVRPKFLRDG